MDDEKQRGSIHPKSAILLYVDKGNYIEYGNLKGITGIPNKNFSEIQPMKGTDAVLPKYKYSYGCPIHLLNVMRKTSAQITALNLTTELPMTDLHDWREMDDVIKLRQGDTYTHIWKNPSLLRKLLMNIYVQDNYTIQGPMVCILDLMMLEIQGGFLTAWDGGLDVATGPKFGTLAKETESNFKHGEERKRIRPSNQEDIAMTEISNLNYDYKQQRAGNTYR